jgi:hypothetical protein
LVWRLQECGKDCKNWFPKSLYMGG